MRNLPATFLLAIVSLAFVLGFLTLIADAIEHELDRVTDAVEVNRVRTDTHR